MKEHISLPSEQSILITGASSGIGKATAIYLANYYKRIAITGFSHPDALTDTKEQITSLGAECLSFTGDIGDPSFVNSMSNELIKAWGHIDILINNASISLVGLLTDMTNEQWNRIISSNLSSVFYTCRAFIPSMVHEKEGRILNISSVWGEVGASCEAAYSATKGGVNALTRSLAKELAPSGISVNAISFGAIDTPMNACFSKEDLLALTEEIPAGKMGSVEDAAQMIYACLSMPTYTTGQVFRMDGGWI